MYLIRVVFDDETGDYFNEGENCGRRICDSCYALMSSIVHTVMITPLAREEGS